MTRLDIAVAGVFCLIVLIAGLSFVRLSSRHGSRSFFSGGGAVPWWVSGLSLYMSFFSVGTFVVWGSIAYSDGVVAISIQMMMCLAGLVIGFFIASRWNKSNALTAAEYLGDRFGVSTKTIYTSLFLVTSVIGLGGYIYPVGRIIEVSTGIPLPAALIGLSVFILLYTAIGGLWAVLVTDVLQFVVLSAAVIIIVPLALAQVGGFEGFIAQAPEGFFNLSTAEFTPEFLFAFFIYNTIFIGGHWAYVQRYTSVKSPRAARKVAWLFSGLYILSPIIWMLPPMIYRIMQPELQGLENEGAYMLLSKEILPHGVLGLMITAMVFATASSVNTVLNITAGVFTNDVYAVMKPKSDPKTVLWVARISTAVFGLIALGSAFMVGAFGGIVSMVLSIAAITGGALFLPPIWSLFSHRQTAFSILTATLVTIAINLFCNFVMPHISEAELTRTSQMVLGVATPILILGGFELFYRLQGRYDPAYESYKTIRDERGVLRRDMIAASEASDVTSMVNTVIGTSIILVGLLVTGLGFISGDAASIVFVVGLVIVGLGLIMNPKTGRVFTRVFKQKNTNIAQGTDGL